MECNEYKTLINSFLDDKIESERLLEQFVKHSRECRDCREELEVFCAVRIAINDDDRIDKKLNSDDEYGYDFDKRVNDLLKFHEDELRKHKYIKKIINYIFISNNSNLKIYIIFNE